MNIRTKTSTTIAAAAIAAAALTTAPVNAQSLSSYTYQGVLDNTGAPAQGVHQFRFRIFETPTGGTPLCADTRTKNFSADDQGRFTFDDLACTAPFEPGKDRWIEVSVRQGTSGPFTVLGPRHIVNATPFALYAQDAGTSLDDAYNNGNVINTIANPLIVSGDLQIGDANAVNGSFSFQQADHPVPSLIIQPFPFGSTANGNTGASFILRDELNANLFVAEPDVDDEGIFFFLEGGSGNLTFDGKASATNVGPRLDLFGPASALTFNTNLSGNTALTLPNNAVSRSEIFDEPGIARERDAVTGPTILPSDGIVNIASKTITAPNDGWVLAIATYEAFFNNGTGGGMNFNSAISDVPATFIDGIEYSEEIAPGTSADAQLGRTITVSGIFGVNAGPTSFYLVGDVDSGTDVQIIDSEFSLIYIPTFYGTVTRSAPNRGAPGFDTFRNDEHIRAGQTSAPLTPADIAAEQAEAAAFDQQRRDAEFRAMQQRLADLERRLEEALQSQSATR